MDAPVNEEWGPALWNLLHSAAERIGTVSSLRTLPQEESRLWSNLFHGLRRVIPCPTCKKHYSEYLAAHPLHLPKQLSTAPGLVRDWLFQFHSAVNQRLQKDTAFDAAIYSAYYQQPFSYSELLGTFMEHVRRGMVRGIVSHTDYIVFVRQMEEFRRFYGWA